MIAVPNKLMCIAQRVDWLELILVIKLIISPVFILTLVELIQQQRSEPNQQIQQGQQLLAHQHLRHHPHMNQSQQTHLHIRLLLLTHQRQHQQPLQIPLFLEHAMHPVTVTATVNQGSSAIWYLESSDVGKKHVLISQVVTVQLQKYLQRQQQGITNQENQRQQPDITNHNQQLNGLLLRHLL